MTYSLHVDAELWRSSIASEVERVQRVLVHESAYPGFRKRLVDATSRLAAGDPKDEATFVGPMISEAEAARLDGWIRAAVAEGATLLCGGHRDGGGGKTGAAHGLSFAGVDRERHPI